MNVRGLSNLANILVRITRETGKSPYNLKQARAGVCSIDPSPHFEDIHRTRTTGNLGKESEKWFHTVEVSSVGCGQELLC